MLVLTLVVTKRTSEALCQQSCSAGQDVLLQVVLLSLSLRGLPARSFQSGAALSNPMVPVRRAPEPLPVMRPQISAGIRRRAEKKEGVAGPGFREHACQGKKMRPHISAGVRRRAKKGEGLGEHACRGKKRRAALVRRAARKGPVPASDAFSISETGRRQIEKAPPSYIPTFAAQRGCCVWPNSLLSRSSMGGTTRA